MKIRQKLSITILGTAIAIFAITIGYFNITSRGAAERNISELMDSHADHYACMISNWLNSDMALVRSLARAYGEHGMFPFYQWRMLTNGIYSQVLASNAHIDAIWDSWEESHLDTTRYLPDAYTAVTTYREHGVIRTEGGRVGPYNQPLLVSKLRTLTSEAITEPYAAAHAQGGLMASLVAPILVNGGRVGIVGIDLDIDRFRAMVSGIKPFPESFTFLVSNGGMLVAHPDTGALGRTIFEAFPQLDRAVRLSERVRIGDKFSFTHAGPNGAPYYFSISPIEVGGTQTPWAFGIALPVQAMLRQANRDFNIGLLVGFAGLALLAVVLFSLIRRITRPIHRLTHLLEDLAKGKIEGREEHTAGSNDEIGQMSHALALSIEGLKAKTQFASQIGHGELGAELELLSDHDLLGKSLLEMRDSLLHAKLEDDKRKVEDDMRAWVNEGLARFGDILRQNNDNLNALGDEVIKNLVWYLKASVGGVYIAQEDTSPITLKLIAAFAYDRKRFLKKSFEIGEGLVGACAHERESIFITQVPPDYIEVTSGLGETPPSCLLLIPLKIEHVLLGVIELASLNVLKPYEIEFAEKLAQSISSTLRTVSINQKTSELLRKSQEQAEIMAAQDEEMRQNMEELLATQEEAARKSSEMEGLIQALNESSYIVEYDLKGTIINISNAFLELLGITREEVMGRQHADNLILTAQQKLDYDEFWNALRRGRVMRQTTQIRISGKDFRFLETYAPIRQPTGEVYKVFKISTDITGS